MLELILSITITALSTWALAKFASATKINK